MNLADLEASVIFIDGVGELDSLALLDERAQCWVVVHADVVADEAAVEAVATSLLLVIQQIAGCVCNHKTEGHDTQQADMLSFESDICSINVIVTSLQVYAVSAGGMIPNHNERTLLS